MRPWLSSRLLSSEDARRYSNKRSWLFRVIGGSRKAETRKQRRKRQKKKMKHTTYHRLTVMLVDPETMLRSK